MDATVIRGGVESAGTGLEFLDGLDFLRTATGRVDPWQSATARWDDEDEEDEWVEEEDEDDDLWDDEDDLDDEDDDFDDDFEDEDEEDEEY